MTTASRGPQPAAMPADSSVRATLAATGLIVAIALSISACSAQPATKDPVAAESSANACDIARSQEVTGENTKQWVRPVVSADGGNITYQFTPATTPIASLTATCGNGAYSECQVSIAVRDGTGFSFSALSRFALLQMGDDLWMVYRLQPTTFDAGTGKRRVVKVAREPVTLCNEIGDYSDVM